jgi:hypothetical protein
MVLSFSNVQLSVQGDQGDTIQVDLLRNDSIVDTTGPMDVVTTLVGLFRLAPVGIGLPDVPPSGEHTYKVRLTATDDGLGTADAGMIVHKITTVYLELRR